MDVQLFLHHRVQRLLRLLHDGAPSPARAARSLFTGRGVWASGRDMFVVGFGVAAIGYLIGEWITRCCDRSTSRALRLWPVFRSVCT